MPAGQLQEKLSYLFWEIHTSGYLPEVPHANAGSMDIGQVGLEVCMQSQGYDLAEVAEVWWDSSWDWRPSMTGYRLFRMNRLGC